MPKKKKFPSRRPTAVPAANDSFEEKLDRGKRILVVRGKLMTLVYRVGHLTVHENMAQRTKVTYDVSFGSENV